MATSKSKSKTINKKIVKKVAKKAKKNPGIFIALLIILVIAVVLFIIFKDDIIPSENNSDNITSEETSHFPSHHEDENNVLYENFQIHFLELGNVYTGDCTYIKAGDTDILIDAGSRQASAEIIESYVDKYCSDGKLEYVIATHAHQDHIAGMVGNTKTADNKTPKNYLNESVDKTGILYYYQIDTLIDFAITDSSSTLYANYQNAVNYAISKGTKHYNSAECFNELNGAKRQYVLDDSLDITMDILYNKYYFESAKSTSGEENNYSVCTMFNYADHHYLLTGDLEIEGEQSLASYYDKSTSEKTLPHCDLFKAGHHGSPTSSNDCLLSLITPDICCVCCCAGCGEYTNNYNNQFPSQEFINRIAKYTDRVYVTTMIKLDSAKNEYVNDSLNGNIIVSSNGNEIGLSASNNLTKLKDSEWFNRIIYVKDGKSAEKKGTGNYYTKDSEGVTGVVQRVWPS